MKKCKTLNGLLQSIQNNEICCFEYTSQSALCGGYVIQGKNGKQVVVQVNTYKVIEPYLRKI